MVGGRGLRPYQAPYRRASRAVERKRGMPGGGGPCVGGGVRAFRQRESHAHLGETPPRGFGLGRTGLARGHPAATAGGDSGGTGGGAVRRCGSSTRATRTAFTRYRVALLDRTPPTPTAGVLRSDRQGITRGPRRCGAHCQGVDQVPGPMARVERPPAADSA